VLEQVVLEGKSVTVKCPSLVQLQCARQHSMFSNFLARQLMVKHRPSPCFFSPRVWTRDTYNPDLASARGLVSRTIQCGLVARTVN
jgi:hypothetical protein